jgi:hypothetical protein
MRVVVYTTVGEFVDMKGVDREHAEELANGVHMPGVAALHGVDGSVYINNRHIVKIEVLSEGASSDG